MLNPRCTEEEIVEELNLVLRDDRLKRAKAKQAQAEQENSAKEAENPEEAKKTVPVAEPSGMNHFILSAIVSSLVLLNHNVNNNIFVCLDNIGYNRPEYAIFQEIRVC